jgi:hypothetical protein
MIARDNETKLASNVISRRRPELKIAALNRAREADTEWF